MRKESSSDFNDSFLKEVIHAQRLPRMPLTGERLGGKDGRRFQIRAPLGGGGMGQVFRESRASPSSSWSA